MPHQPVTRRENQAPLLCRTDAGRGAAEVGPGTRVPAADLDKHGGIAIAADQVDLPALDPEVALDHVQAMPGEVLRGKGLPLIAGDLLGGGADAARHRMGRMQDKSIVPALYVVATPIGNLGDITLRALDTLRAADLVACEDTRHARRLLDHHGIRTSTLAVHQHNENAAAVRVIEAIRGGQRVALISDAGTPGISDPGSRTVAAVRAAGLPVVPLPGPSAAIAALSAAGLTDEHFLFVGFLPAKVGARRTALEKLLSIDAALVFYEAPHRVTETVADLLAVLGGEREIVVARELTKLFEQIERLPLNDAPAWFSADPNRQRGEFVLIVSAPPPREGLDADTDRVLKTLLAELPVKQAARFAAEITGAGKNDLYQRALALKSEPL